MSEVVAKSEPKLSRTIKFNAEYEFEGKKFSSCEMRKPRVSDRRKAKKIADLNGFDDEEMEMHLFAGLTGLPVEFIASMWLEDYLTLSNGFLDFLGLGKKNSA